jgi:dienelactone hydrolase
VTQLEDGWGGLGLRALSSAAMKLIERLATNARRMGVNPWPALCPSSYHRGVAEELIPSMGYRGGSVSEWQRSLSPVVRRLLAETPFESPPLDARTLWKRTSDLGTIEKLIFHSQRGVEVPAYLCLPHLATPPYPVLVCLQGHSTGMHNSIGVARWDESRQAQVAGDRALALGCMSRGVAALCIEQRALGERAEQINRWQQVTYHECTEAAMHGLLIGQTLIGQRVHDVERGLDLLEERAIFDMQRVGVLGQSGGGTVALYAAAMLPRVKIVVASGAFCSFRESLLPRLHCPDNYVPSILRYCEMGDVLGLFAPRPAVVVAGRVDPIFPFGGFERAVEQSRRIYDAAGAADRLHAVACSGGHRFYAEATWRQVLPYLRPPNSLPIS